MNEIDVDNLKYLYDIRANIPLIAACSLIAILLRNAVCNSCKLKRQKGREEFIKEKMNEVEAVLIGERDGRETEVERKDQKTCVFVFMNAVHARTYRAFSAVRARCALYVRCKKVAAFV